MTQKILVTSALPYANGPLHFGHIAGAYLPADCYVRFQRLMKEDVVYICGSDEYGIAITLSAELAKRTPKEHVDLFHYVNREFFEKLQISFDHYSRTTWEGHREPTHQFFNDLLANHYIEARITDQLYSEADQKFLADRYVIGTCPRCGFENARGDECPRCGASYEATELKNPRSKLTNAPLVHRSTKHWFLLLDQFKERLKAWLKTKNWKPNVINFIKDYIDHLHARAITRDMTWGIPVPLLDAEGKVLYVWFDAPIGYISATKEWSQHIQQPERWKDYWFDPNTKLVQFIGKDNIPFHASIFPAMVMGQNLPYKLVDELPANEFYNLEGRQFSKSDGWYIDLEDFFKRYTSDQIRYAIASNAPETSDSEFTWKDFQHRCNADLLGKYGNLVNRVLVFIRNQCNGLTPLQEGLETIDHQFLQNIQQIVQQIAESYDQFKLRRASQLVMELAQLGNIYFDSKRPWQDAKQEATRSRMRTTLACCLECLKTLALISFPIIPTTAEHVWQMLGYHDTIQQRGWRKILSEKILEGQPIPVPVILFQKIEDEQIEEEIQKLKQLSAANAKKEQQAALMAATPSINPLKPAITIEDVRKLDLRIGIIRQAEAIPKSKKLLRLHVDIGLEQRIIVAGIGESYRAEDLIGRSVVVVANLKPATLMGVQSEGMLLAAKQPGQLELILVENSLPGSEVS
jgi:methionyl-tRNA synthetase